MDRQYQKIKNMAERLEVKYDQSLELNEKEFPELGRGVAKYDARYAADREALEIEIKTLEKLLGEAIKGYLSQLEIENKRKESINNVRLFNGQAEYSQFREPGKHY